MICSMTLLCVLFYGLGIQHCWWVIVANYLGGVGVGAIEPTLLSSISPLGDATKVWMLYGLAIGFNFMSVIGFYVISLGVPLWSIYTLCGVMCIISMCWYLRIMNHVQRLKISNRVNSIGINENNFQYTSSSTTRLKQFWVFITEYKQWFFKVLPHGVILTLCLFALNFFCTVSVENFSIISPSSLLKYSLFLHLFSIQFYVFFDGKIPLISDWWIDRNLYFALSGALNAVGQALGNRAAYYWKCIRSIGQRHPFYFTICQMLCGLACSCIYFIQPLVILFAICGVFTINGAIYASGIKFIDSNVSARYNLVALSVFFVFADVGSIVGQNTFECIVEYVCGDDGLPHYYCDHSGNT